jgi:2-C-methyl-D-erythritol 4-phosphate cytidylyltransferase
VGAERQDSVMNALAALPADIEHVFIHDCARPLVRPERIGRVAQDRRAAKKP